MKYVIIPFIALGFVLSLVVGIEYQCEGSEMFPTYYGSPFVFKKTSLGSSMEYLYSVFGLVLNVFVWSVLLFFLDKGFKKIIKVKVFKITYKVIVGLCVVFSILNIAMDLITIGIGFDQNLNYWYWDVDKEAKDWGMICKGQICLFWR